MLAEAGQIAGVVEEAGPKGRLAQLDGGKKIAQGADGISALSGDADVMAIGMERAGKAGQFGGVTAVAAQFPCHKDTRHSRSPCKVGGEFRGRGGLARGRGSGGNRSCGGETLAGGRRRG